MAEKLGRFIAYIIVGLVSSIGILCLVVVGWYLLEVVWRLLFEL